MKSTEGYVYLICDPLNDRYKIGVTKGKVNKRMLKLQTGNSTELHIICQYKTEFPFRMEKMLHLKYDQYRVHGEWFDLPDNDIIHFEEVCKDIEFKINALKDNPFFSKGLRE